MLSIGKVIGIINSVFGMSRSGTTTTISGTLSATAVTAATVTATTTLAASAAATVGTTLNVTGTTTLAGVNAGAATATSLTGLSDGLNVTGNTVLQGALTSPVHFGGAVADPTRASRLILKKTGIVDNTATAVVTVTVPNANHAASIDLDILSSNGGTDAFESSRCAKGRIVLARVTDADTVAVATALALATIATVTGGDTHTLAYDLSAIAGANTDPQTFDIRITINAAGDQNDHQAVIVAEVINAEATGVTIAAA